MADVLKTAFSGSFFPGDKETLKTMIEGFLASGGPPADHAVGLVSPHAGLVYSGATAGMGFASAPDGVRQVILCAPSHRYPLGGAAVFDIDGIETPLGICPVSRAVSGKLAATFEPTVFHEHSLEVLVPFVQVRWPAADIVPVILGMAPDCGAVARTIMDASAEAFFVASSDLSHFHSLDTARILDRKVMDGFLSLSTSAFIEGLSSGGEACGRHPMLTLLHFAELAGASSARMIHYSTSADAGGDPGEVVGYFSALVT